MAKRPDHVLSKLVNVGTRLIPLSLRLRRQFATVPERLLSLSLLIDQATPPKKDLHLICDNYATHKHPKGQRRLARHKRFHVHFTPTSASWVNMVERFFRDLTQNRLKRGVFRDLEELIMAVEGYIDRHNHKPKPFIWTASALDIPREGHPCAQGL